jgi:hypothetical protein
VEGKEVMEGMEEKEEMELEGLKRQWAKGIQPEDLWPVSRGLLK